MDGEAQPVSRKTRILLIAGTLVLAVVVGLAGWFWPDGDDDNGRSGSDDSASVSESADPTSSGEEPPEFPAAAKAPTAAGVEAAIRHRYDTIHYAQRTGNFEPLERTFDETCRLCINVRDQLKHDLSEGRTMAGGEYTTITVRDARTSQLASGAIVGTADVDLVRGPQEIFDKEGNSIYRGDGEQGTLAFTLLFDEDRWVITDVR